MAALLSPLAACPSSSSAADTDASTWGQHTLDGADAALVSSKLPQLGTVLVVACQHVVKAGIV